jgi:tetratricopeptide (TPR) repeat protein
MRLLIFLPVLFALLVLPALPATAQDWSGRGRVQGRVTTEDGKPIEGATVRLYFGGDTEEGPEPVTSNRKGRWSVLGLRTGQWSFIIEADGYVSAEGGLSVSELKANPPLLVELRSVEDTPEAQKGREVQGWINEANANFQRGNYSAARELYEKALPELAEDSKPAVIRAIAQTLVQDGKTDEALARINQVLALAPEDSAMLKLKAGVLGQQGKTEEALGVLSKLIEVNPDDVEAIRLTANILLSKGREEEAQPYLDMLAAKGEKADPNAFLNLGIEKYNAGDVAAALPYFERAAAENPDLPEVYYYRGLAYLASGNVEAAKADFEHFMEIAPEHEKAAEVKSFLEAL